MERGLLSLADGVAVLDLRDRELTLDDVESVLERLNQQDLRRIVVDVRDSADLAAPLGILVRGLEWSSMAYGVVIDIREWEPSEARGRTLDLSLA